jgi:hypothetical protein
VRLLTQQSHGPLLFRCQKLLVSKSSAQFIHASMVTKFFGGKDCHDPKTRQLRPRSNTRPPSSLTDIENEPRPGPQKEEDELNVKQVLLKLHMISLLQTSLLVHRSCYINGLHSIFVILSNKIKYIPIILNSDAVL